VIVSVPGVRPVASPDNEPMLTAEVLDQVPPDTQSVRVTGDEMHSGGRDVSGQTEVVTVMPEVTKHPVLGSV